MILIAAFAGEGGEVDFRGFDGFVSEHFRDGGDGDAFVFLRVRRSCDE